MAERRSVSPCALQKPGLKIQTNEDTNSQQTEKRDVEKHSCGRQHKIYCANIYMEGKKKGALVS